MFYNATYDDDRAELRAQGRYDQRYRSNLRAHPDCRDPDHPGCSCCEEDDQNGED